MMSHETGLISLVWQPSVNVTLKTVNAFHIDTIGIYFFLEWTEQNEKVSLWRKPRNGYLPCSLYHNGCHGLCLAVSFYLSVCHLSVYRCEITANNTLCHIPDTNTLQLNTLNTALLSSPPSRLEPDTVLTTSEHIGAPSHVRGLLRPPQTSECVLLAVIKHKVQKKRRIMWRCFKGYSVFPFPPASVFLPALTIHIPTQKITFDTSLFFKDEEDKRSKTSSFLKIYIYLVSWLVQV